MRKLSVALAIAALSQVVCLAADNVPAFRKIQLSDKFYCEGAYYADFNRDGKMDIVAGPFWYEGPDFRKRHEIRPPQEFDPKNYSDNFLTFTGDFNGDGWPDVLYVSYPGNDAYWYENPAPRAAPGKSTSRWRTWATNRRRGPTSMATAVPN